MNASEMTFGIEIECYLPRDCGVIPGAYHHGNQIIGFPEGWNAQQDGSLRAPTARCVSAVRCVETAPLAIMGLWARPNKLIALRRGNPLHVAETCRGVYLASLPAGMPGEVRAVADNHVMTFRIRGGKVRGQIREITSTNEIHSRQSE